MPASAVACFACGSRVIPALVPVVVGPVAAPVSFVSSSGVLVMGVTSKTVSKMPTNALSASGALRMSIRSCTLVVSKTSCSFDEATPIPDTVSKYTEASGRMVYDSRELATPCSAGCVFEGPLCIDLTVGTTGTIPTKVTERSYVTDEVTSRCGPVGVHLVFGWSGPGRCDVAHVVAAASSVVPRVASQCGWLSC